MSVVTAEVARPAGLPTRAVANAALWIAVFLGGFVFYEPAPYDLYLAVVIPLWMLLGFRTPQAISPLIVLMALFMAGGVLAATQAKHLDEQPIYMAISGFLALSACFFAGVTAGDARRLKLVIDAWTAAAVVTSALGILGYLGLTGELFVRYGRATGGFQDPNVFGPFLVLPLLVLTRRVMTGSLRTALVCATPAVVIFAGIFLSFSRATWGLTVICVLMVGLLLFLMERSAMLRARLIAMAMAGVIGAAVFLAAALSVPTVADLFEQRARVVQEYDAGHMGRFDRHAAGYNMMLEHPLGIGAMEFGKIYGEDEHSIWLKALTTYGWLGFAAFFVLVVWTLLAAFPLLFRSGPAQAVTQIAYVVFVGHILMATLIDIDHWRHFFLLLGLLWGAIATDRMERHKRLAAHRQALWASHVSAARAA